MLESMFIDNGIIDNTTPYYSYLCSEWTMNVAAKVILIVFGALVGHCLTILFPQSENWTISLWNHHVFFIFFCCGLPAREILLNRKS